ncbi:hypothetical protein TOC8171_15530 [Pseudomonas syringae]
MPIVIGGRYKPAGIGGFIRKTLRHGNDITQCREAMPLLNRPPPQHSLLMP